MPKTYNLKKVSCDINWDKFIEKSPDYSVFFNSIYLNNINRKIHTFFVYNAAEVRAAIALPVSDKEDYVIEDDFLIYSGVVIGNKTNDQSISQVNAERFYILEFIANELPKLYSKIHFSFSPSIFDMRPFQWYRYGEKEGIYNINTKYTSYVSIDDFIDKNNYQATNLYKNASSSRRQQIRYALRDNIHTEEFNDVDLFIDFYNRTFLRQNIIVTDKYLDKMSHLISILLKNSMAKMFITNTSEGNQGSIAVFSFDKNKSYYLFGASDPEYRNSPVGTSILWVSFFKLREYNFKLIDLEGINSPKRGWFKLSFGGSIIPYFQIIK